MRKIAGVVVYNPTESDIDTLKLYLSYFDNLIIYRNSPIIFKDILTNEKVVLIGNELNDGLSVACNEICRKAKEMGYNSVIIFDQDSYIDNISLNLLYKQLEKEVNSFSNWGILCPRVQYATSTDNMLKGVTDVEWCITSGSLFNLSIYGDKINFDESYFIDRVDKDYCQQLVLSGYKIRQIHEAILQQSLGTTIHVLCGKYSSHSSARHYYMARNRLYYNKKYNVSRIITLVQTCRHLFEVILYETDKQHKLKAMIVGIFDFYKGNMGRKKYE